MSSTYFPYSTNRIDTGCIVLTLLEVLMPLSILFWVIYIICLVFGVWGFYVPGQPWYRPAGGYVILWILVGILGWHVFGPAVR